MKRTVILGALFLGLVLGSAALAANPKHDLRNPQYMLGYSAGRRDERLDLCQRFERHITVAQSLLGQARMVLVRAFCKSKP